MLVRFLRALLEAFIGSKKGWASNQSMPSGQVIKLPFVSDRIQGYTAPCDGWLIVSAEGARAGFCHTWSSNLGCASYGSWSAVTLVLRKGEFVNYKLESDSSNARVQFVKSIGSV